MSNRIKELRKKQSFTQGELAKRLGVSLKTLQNWERGENEMTLKSAIQLCKVLKVDLKQIISEDGSSDLIVNEPSVNFGEPELSKEDQVLKLNKRIEELENLNADLQKALIKAMDKL